MDLIASATAAANDFAGPLPQIYRPEEAMDMVFDTYGKYNAKLDFSDNGWQKTQPVWGILTTPLFSPMMETSTFSYPHFSWETNVNFLHYAGSWAVPIRYDLSDEDMEAMLDSVNGVFLGGGAMHMMDWDTGETSDWYKMSKRVWDYMLK